MAILVDYSQACVSAVFRQIDSKGQLKKNDSWLLKQEGFDQSSQLSPGLLRHIILNDLLYHKRRFAKEYGEFIFCIDAKNPWRKQVFPHYKWKRGKDKQASLVDWDMIDDFKDTFEKELQEELGYKVMRVQSAEADDVIAVLTKHLHQSEKVLILSSDKDFPQLFKYPNVTQYSPAKKDYWEIEDPRYYLFCHIVGGDVDDGIPNILSPNNCLVDGFKRKQTPVFKKKLPDWYKQGFKACCQEWGEAAVKRWHQNRKLIDFDQIPAGIMDRIMDTYNTMMDAKLAPMNWKQSGRFTNYFMKHGLSELLENIGEFGHAG